MAASISADLVMRLPGQNKNQREGLALPTATMLDVRSANLMDLSASLPRDAERIDVDWVMASFAGEVLRRALRQRTTRLAEGKQTHRRMISDSVVRSDSPPSIDDRLSGQNQISTSNPPSASLRSRCGALSVFPDRQPVEGTNLGVDAPHEAPNGAGQIAGSGHHGHPVLQRGGCDGCSGDKGGKRSLVTDQPIDQSMYRVPCP